MTLNCTVHEFLNTASCVVMTAHRSDGTSSSVRQAKKRWCFVFFERMANTLAKTSAALAAAALMGLPLAAAQTRDSEQTHPTQALRPARGEFIQTDAGVSPTHKQWVLDGISAQVRRKMHAVVITSQANETTESPQLAKSPITPSARTHMQGGKATCHIELGGLDWVLHAAWGDDRRLLSEERAQRLRKLIVQHEAAHCEMDVLEETSSTALMAPWAQQKKSLLLEPFTLRGALPTSEARFSVFEQVKTLQAERFADARALLISLREKTSALGPFSASAQVQAAVQTIHEDIEGLSMMRRAESKMLDTFSAIPPIVYDHDTSAVIALISAAIGKNPLAFANASDLDISQIAGALATATLSQDRVAIMELALTRTAAELRGQILTETSALERLATQAHGARETSRKGFALVNGSARTQNEAPNEQLLTQRQTGTAHRAAQQQLVPKLQPGLQTLKPSQASNLKTSGLAVSSGVSKLVGEQTDSLEARALGLAARKQSLSFIEQALAEPSWKRQPEWPADVASYMQASLDVCRRLAQGESSWTLARTLAGKQAFSLQGGASALDAQMEIASKAALRALGVAADILDLPGAQPTSGSKPAGLRN